MDIRTTICFRSVCGSPPINEDLSLRPDDEISTDGGPKIVPSEVLGFMPIKCFCMNSWPQTKGMSALITLNILPPTLKVSTLFSLLLPN